MPELNDPTPPAGFIARLKTLLSLPADTAGALGGKANSGSLAGKANAADVYTKAQTTELLAGVAGSPVDVVLSRGNVAAVRPDLLSVVFKGHLRPTSMRSRFDVLQTLPAGVPVLGGTAPGALTVTVGTTDATLGLPTVAVETWITGQSATTTTLAVTTPQAVQALAVPSSLFPAGSSARQYNVRVRGIPADVVGVGGVLETGVSLASEWSAATTFTVAALADSTPPVWSAIPAVTGAEGSAAVVINLATYLTDDSGAAPAVALVGSPAGVTLSGLTLTVSRAAVVADTITLRATDGGGNTADATVSRTVTAPAPSAVAPVDFRFEETSGNFANSGSLGGTMVAPAGVDYSGDGVLLPDNHSLSFGGATFASDIGMTTHGAPNALYMRAVRPAEGSVGTHEVGFLTNNFRIAQDYNGGFARARYVIGTHTGDNSVVIEADAVIEFFAAVEPQEGGGRRLALYERRAAGAWVPIAGGASNVQWTDYPLGDGPFEIQGSARRMQRLVFWTEKSGGGDVTLADLAAWGVQL